MKKLLTHIVLYTILLLCIVSCSSYPIKYAPYKFDGTKNTGLIIGTISIVNSGTKYSHYDLFFRKEEHKNKKRNTIRISPDQTFLTKFKPDFVRGDTMVFQYVYERQAGTYEFTGYELFNNKGLIQTYKKPKGDISIPFEVKSKEISYLGDIVLNSKNNKDEPLIRWYDHFEKDKQQFIDRFPHYYWDQLANRTIKKGVIRDESIKFMKD